MGGGGIEIVPDFFGVFAVVAFGVGQSKNSFFENGVAFVPEGEGEAESGVAVGDPEEAIFAPAIGAASGIVVGEVAPGIAVGRIIFADRSPLALGKVGTPAFPVGCPAFLFGESAMFGCSALGHGLP